MADKDIGCVLVMQGEVIAGIVSERDCARRVVLAGKSAEATKIADIMVRNVITADLSHTFADCLQLMHQHGIRHLPIVENGRPVTVISIRDLLSEAVSHHAKIIGELERERLTIFTSTA
jgi:CBS domain-containing protein